MPQGPEPQDRNIGNVPPFSVEDQLKAFRRKLDGPPDTRITIPGFLFRNGQDRKYEPLRYRFTLSDGSIFPGIQRRMLAANDRLAHIDEDLLHQHIETYRRGLETRELLLARIKPVEILGMVRDVWGKGEIKQTELGATIIYSYPVVTEERTSDTSESWRSSWDSGYDYGGYVTDTRWYKTGKWYANLHSVSERIDVNFGNAMFPHPESVNNNAVDEYFADFFYDHSSKGFPDTTIWGTYFSDFRSPDRKLPNGKMERYTDNLELFRGIPRTIWRRPDNLGIRITVPGAPLNDGERDYLVNNPTEYLPRSFAWFDKSTSQQEIIDFLAQKLEDQKAGGYLPPQVETIELAKIEELRKRRLFIEPRG